MHDLNPVAVVQVHLRPTLSADDLAIMFHGDASRGEAEIIKQRRYRDAVGDGARFTIDADHSHIDILKLCIQKLN
jgi:hypothetical protein